MNSIYDREYDASIVISTKNRKDELQKCLESCLAQEGDIQVIVIDDGSTDGTYEMLVSKYPHWQYPNLEINRSCKSLGLIAQRNRGAALASAPIIISLDDDAIFSESSTVQKTLSEFSDERIGAVAIPYVDVLYGTEIKQLSPCSDVVHFTSQFRGTAYAVRKDVFTILGGFREILFRQNEETDYCLRMMDAGYYVRLGSASPIQHYESPNRDQGQIVYYQTRNNIVVCVLNVPYIFILFHLFVTTTRSLLSGIKRGRGYTSVLGAVDGFAAAVSNYSQRHSVSLRAYRQFRVLRKQGSLPATNLLFWAAKGDNRK